MILHLAHISMQSTDTPSQQRADAAKVFAQATARGYAWITGTEANTGAIEKIFREEAIRAHFYFVRGGDAWIAVPESRMAGKPVAEWYPVIKGMAHQFPNRGVLRVSFHDKALGPTTVLASHFQTKRTSKQRPEDNQHLSAKVGELAKQYGAGAGLVFYGGDQNITDRTGDTFKGQPLTSCWDELKYWPGTGHDNIDVIASYDADDTVKCIRAEVYTDKRLLLNTDHFLVEAAFDVPALVHQSLPKPEKPVKKFVPPKRPVIGGIPNKHSGTDNKDGGIERVVIHSAVIKGEPGAARKLAAMNKTSSTGSWHYATDNREAIQCSWDSYVCWHAPPNRRSLGIEMADWPVPWPAVTMTKAFMRKVSMSWRWKTAYHSALLKTTAELAAELCLEYDLPLRFLSVKMLQKGQKGITIHANVSKAFGQSTHWDPGAWPRFRFMRLVKAHAKKLQS